MVWTCHSRFDDQPAAEIDTANLFAAPFEGNPSSMEIAGRSKYPSRITGDVTYSAGAAATRGLAVASKAVNESGDRMMKLISTKVIKWDD
jgi:hypothetical protein